MKGSQVGEGPQIIEPTWPALITDLLAGEDLSSEQTSWVMDEVMTGAANPISLAGFLVALAGKGETVGELLGLADTMVAHAVSVPIPPLVDGGQVQTVDVVGTGGDRHRSVNISTMAALVVAGAGLPVAKHGNRAASSASGSADVLEALGVKLDLTAQRAGALVNEVGITFLFAQQFHPAFRHAALARVGLGVPTAFNVLGPLTNPAQPRAGAIGVGNLRMAPLLAGVFAQRGQNALVFRSEDGLDELATTAPVRIWEVTPATGGVVMEHRIDLAKEFDLPRASIDDLRGADAHFNAHVARELFAGKMGAVRDAVVLNAAAAIVADGRLLNASETSLLPRLEAAVEIAAAAIDSGATGAIVDRWVTRSRV